MALGTIVEDVRNAVRETLRMSRDPAMLLWGIYLLLVPVYVFKSGLPQPGDWLIVILAPVVLSRRSRRDPYMVPPIRTLYAFTFYVVAINMIWSLVLGNFTFAPKEGFLLSPLFY